MANQTKKITQDELRRMMKEKSAANKTKITSTYAKYNTLDQLTCSLCCTVIKSEKLWNAHLLSRTHKENLVKPNAPAKITTKRRIENSEPDMHSPKKFKGSVVPLTNKGGQQSNGINPPKIQLADYDSSDDEEEEKDNKVAEESRERSSTAVEGKAKKNSVNASLPVGFFDDPKLDAKARNVPFKDKMEEEMAKFQKEIREETEISEAMVEEDYEERRIDREIEDIDEQMGYWKKIYDVIQKAKSTTGVTKKTTEDKKPEAKEESDDDDDDIDVADDDNENWRRKFL